MMILREEKFETAPAIYVEKRDGRRVAFDVSKIYKAMVRAAQEVGPLKLAVASLSMSKYMRFRISLSMSF